MLPNSPSFLYYFFNLLKCIPRKHLMLQLDLTTLHTTLYAISRLTVSTAMLCIDLIRLIKGNSGKIKLNRSISIMLGFRLLKKMGKLSNLYLLSQMILKVLFMNRLLIMQLVRLRKDSIISNR